MDSDSVQVVRLDPGKGPSDREHFLALLKDLADVVRAGDESMVRHVAEQITQVKAGLEAAASGADLALRSVQREMDLRFAQAEVLTVERVNAVQRELTQALLAAKEAVSKAESADHERFAAHNGLLDKMESQQQTYERSMAGLESKLLPRETFEATVHGWESWRAEISARLDRTQGVADGSRATTMDSRAVESTNLAAATLLQQIKSTRWGIYLALLSAALVIAGLIVAIPHP